MYVVIRFIRNLIVFTLLAAGWLILIIVLLAMTGCVITDRISVEAGVGYNLTPEKGFNGPSDIASVAVRYSTDTGWCEYEHISHLSAGRPFNDEREDAVDMVQCGMRFSLATFRRD